MTATWFWLCYNRMEDINSSTCTFVAWMFWPQNTTLCRLFFLTLSKLMISDPMHALKNQGHYLLENLKYHDSKTGHSVTCLVHNCNTSHPMGDWFEVLCDLEEQLSHTEWNDGVLGGTCNGSRLWSKQDVVSVPILLQVIVSMFTMVHTEAIVE